MGEMVKLTALWKQKDKKRKPLFNFNITFFQSLILNFDKSPLLKLKVEDFFLMLFFLFSQFIQHFNR